MSILDLNRDISRDVLIGLGFDEILHSAFKTKNDLYYKKTISVDGCRRYVIYYFLKGFCADIEVFKKHNIDPSQKLIITNEMFNKIHSYTIYNVPDKLAFSMIYDNFSSENPKKTDDLDAFLIIRVQND